ncbi:MAG TPA: hypothetical protein VGD64_15440 [Acidisarcina sp.]
MAECPALAGAVFQGKDEKEALENTRGAMKAWMWAEDQEATRALPATSTPVIVLVLKALDHLAATRVAPFVLTTLFFFSRGVMAQSREHVNPLPNANITHDAVGLTVDAREARPLRQAVYAMRSEFGWVVDYEDPIYNGPADLVDDTSPTWRATHPNLPGVTRPAGERFQFTIPEPFAGASGPQGSDEQHALEQMVVAYSSGGNPGKFKAIPEGSNRFAVVGTGPSQQDGLFEKKITLERADRTAAETLAAILEQTSHLVGKNVGLGLAPVGALLRSHIVMGGTDLPGRQALAMVLDSTHLNLVWEALYDADTDQYLVNIEPVIKSYHDASGQRKDALVPQPNSLPLPSRR